MVFYDDPELTGKKSKSKPNSEQSGQQVNV